MAYLGHLEYENLVRIITLIEKRVPLDISPVAEALKLGDAIYNAKPSQVFKCIDSILKARRIQLFTTIKDKLKFIQRKTVDGSPSS